MILLLLLALFGVLAGLLWWAFDEWRPEETYRRTGRGDE